MVEQYNVWLFVFSQGLLVTFSLNESNNQLVPETSVLRCLGQGFLCLKEPPLWGSLPNTVSWHVDQFLNFASWLIFSVHTVLTDCDHRVSTDGSDLPAEILVMISPSKGWCKCLT